ncbi:MAG: rRNA maturation RNase YbeY [Candidatus Omnitrophica bacterium]|nr:rRNA maturation RNase YbeY [Candidatus Omnitrophota bacterium]
MSLTINLKNNQNKITPAPKKVEKIILSVLKNEKIKKPAEICLFITNDKEIKELNLLYLGENSATDVIAFNLSADKKKIYADIAISAEVAKRNAKIFHTSPLYELYLYVAHGILHILGYNDDTKTKQRIMQAKAEKILECLSLKPKP